jgi:hypothetical protein
VDARHQDGLIADFGQASVPAIRYLRIGSEMISTDNRAHVESSI